MTQELADIVEEPNQLRRLYKRTLLIVVISQIFSGAGLAAGVTVGALLAQDMIGSDSLAGLPAALITLGSAAGAFLVGRLSQRYGRRPGLSAGFLMGGIGALGVVFAAISSGIVLLFISLLIYGVGTATNLQARYAGTDLANPAQRATAVSIVMVSTTLGAVAGPNLVDVMGRFAVFLGIPTLAGPFILAAAAFIIAGVILGVFLRPDPFLVANAIAEAQSPSQNKHSDMKIQPSLNNRGIVVGASVMVMTQIVMVAVMTMTPIHMKHHGHGLAEVGLVIGIHIGSMYIPSLVSGILIDKIGRIAISIASGCILLIACMVAAAAPADSMPMLIIALALLGLGWNLGLISGTALIVDATHPAVRAKTQGTIDVLIAISGASGGALSGMVVAGSSYETLSLAGGFLSLLLIPIVVWSHRARKEEATRDLSV